MSWGLYMYVLSRFQLPVATMHLQSFVSLCSNRTRWHKNSQLHSKCISLQLSLPMH